MKSRKVEVPLVQILTLLVLETRSQSFSYFYRPTPAFPGSQLNSNNFNQHDLRGQNVLYQSQQQHDPLRLRSTPDFEVQRIPLQQHHELVTTPGQRGIAPQTTQQTYYFSPTPPQRDPGAQRFGNFFQQSFPQFLQPQVQQTTTPQPTKLPPNNNFDSSQFFGSGQNIYSVHLGGQPMPRLPTNYGGFRPIMDPFVNPQETASNEIDDSGELEDNSDNSFRGDEENNQIVPEARLTTPKPTTNVNIVNKGEAGLHSQANVDVEENNAPIRVLSAVQKLEVQTIPDFSGIGGDRKIQSSEVPSAPPPQSQQSEIPPTASRPVSNEGLFTDNPHLQEYFKFVSPIGLYGTESQKPLPTAQTGPLSSNVPDEYTYSLEFGPPGSSLTVPQPQFNTNFISGPEQFVGQPGPPVIPTQPALPPTPSSFPQTSPAISTQADAGADTDSNIRISPQPSPTVETLAPPTSAVPSSPEPFHEAVKVIKAKPGVQGKRRRKLIRIRKKYRNGRRRLVNRQRVLQQENQSAPTSQPEINTPIEPRPTPQQAEIYRPTPQAEIYRPTPQSEIYRPTPQAEIYRPTPQAEIYRPTPQAEIYRPTPQAEIYRPTPQAEIYRPTEGKSLVPEPERITTYRSKLRTLPPFRKSPGRDSREGQASSKEESVSSEAPKRNISDRRAQTLQRIIRFRKHKEQSSN